MIIGPRTVGVMAEMITGLLKNHTREIDQAYTKAAGKFSISLGIGINEAKDGLKLETSLSFVSDRVKDSQTRVVNEKQLGLDEQEKDTTT